MRKRDLIRENERLRQRIKHLENILCPAEQHDWHNAQTWFTYGTPSDQTAVFEHNRHIQCCIDTEECLFCTIFKEGCDKRTFVKLMKEAVQQLEAERDAAVYQRSGYPSKMQVLCALFITIPARRQDG